MSEPTGFLYPFIEGDERDATGLIESCASRPSSPVPTRRDRRMSWREGHGFARVPEGLR
jgi:hypothetical protein